MARFSMRLDLATWQEVDAYLKNSRGIIIPTGSTEQHGPMGLIGTDALCSEQIANEAGKKIGAYVAPTLAYTPAPFNMSFPGTISISVGLFEALVTEIIVSLIHHGFNKIYFINGHGANLEPLRQVADAFPKINIRIKSWWDFDPVDSLRQNNFGDWEGMHATPSEISITQATHRTLPPGDASKPPKKLSASFMEAHSGDRHGPPDQHRKEFPDGRVGSHSALANSKVGQKLIDAAVIALTHDYLAMKETKQPVE
jgi:creatinine amidohydrolase